MKCTNCGNELTEGAKFCPECGTPVQKNKFCSNCGTKLAPEAKFCPECGKKVGEAAAKEEKSDEAKALYETALKYYEAKDPRCIEYFNKVSDTIPEAYYYLGLCYFYEEKCGISNDEKKAFEFFKKAVDNGVKEAIFNLGFCYFGFGVAEDQKRSIELFSSNEEDPKCMFGLYRCYKNENESYYDAEKAKYYLKKSADAGHGLACYEMAEKYASDAEEAFSYYLKGAELGHSVCILKVAKLYDSDKDYENAFSYYLKSAELGDRESMSRLGEFYEHGLVGEKDCEKAFEYYKKSAELDCTDGQFNLGRAYQEGIGTEIDLEEAKKWYEVAADYDDRAEKRLEELEEE